MLKVLLVASLLLLWANVSFPHSPIGTKVINTYPVNGALNVHPMTNIGWTFPEEISVNPPSDSIAVFSSEKRYLGRLKLSLNRHTLIFIPSKHFQLSETIHARIGSLLTVNGGYTVPYTLTFSIRKEVAIPQPDFHSDDPITEQMLHHNYFFRNDQSASILSGDLDTLPAITIKKDESPENGYIYIANYTWKSIQPLTYGLVLDQNGNVKNVMGNGADYYNDFKPHPGGVYSFFDAIKNKFYISDTNFSIIDSITAPAKYVTDGHELRITSDGNYWFIAIDYVVTDMSKIVNKGRNPAVIVAPIILEYDAAKNLIFEWRTLDHFQITDATYEDLLSAQIDYCHVNSIAFDGDSNILISSRHMDEITKVDRQTGDIIWRWGGKNNQFRLEGDTLPFSHQHDIRRTAAGTYTMMDNGNFHDVPLPFSRALEFRLDQDKKIATEIWQFRHNPDVFSGAMGNVQRLPDNSTLIGWGECDSLSVTEVDSNNTTRFEMLMPGGTYSYRAYKYDTNYIRKSLSSSGVAVSATSTAEISIMPNPMTGAALIEYSAAKAGYADLSLFDAVGSEISKVYSGYLSEGKHEFSINAKNLSGGAYYLSGRIGSSVAEAKVVVLK